MNGAARKGCAGSYSAREAARVLERRRIAEVPGECFSSER